MRLLASTYLSSNEHGGDALPARRDMLNVAEQILQLGFIKKHIHNFLADIVSRESHKIGEGTMVLKAAAVNMLADAEVCTGEKNVQQC